MLRLSLPHHFFGRVLLFLLTLAALLLPRALHAQQSSAAINGTVKDSSGAVVEGATITLTNNETSVARNSVSNSAGDYVFIDVQPAA